MAAKLSPSVLESVDAGMLGYLAQHYANVPVHVNGTCESLLDTTNEAEEYRVQNRLRK